ncbi:HAD family hydrolase [Arthrobacter sp. PsM3]|uniref:HAD family hydrolase n=1 Tax=Arthrobacter sp. PsM3 TaxID=3030531 RepID=UPI00263A6726|nr:HAD family hydrolase [Arthrobacter sp. PsM3]MDN4644688.1 HAD family hydrolase [Arthrobacter sp. PsM3]
MTCHDGFELVGFDCDGLLVDSEVIAVRVDLLVLADLGWELEREEIVERFVGRSEADLIAAVEEQLGIELGEGWDRKYEPWYRTAFERDLAAVDGVEETLDGLCWSRTASTPAGAMPGCGARSGRPDSGTVSRAGHGVQAARSAGMHVFAYAGGVTPAGRLEGPGTTVLHDMRQLPGLIDAGRP